MVSDYDVVVIGGGAAGLVAATGTAALGARTALIEKKKLGGDCTWLGCIPSKTMLKSAHVFWQLKRLRDFGITGQADCRPDGIMAHVRDTANKISTHHVPELFEKKGVKVIFGSPRFIDNRAIEVGGVTISSKRFIICTGSRPVIPEIDGIKDSGYLTNETIFDLDAVPESMAVLGGGPIGLEISQACARLGAKVSIIEAADRILFREDKEVADLLADALEKEGIEIVTGTKAVKFSKEKGIVSITLEDKEGKETTVRVQEAMIAVGRAANVEGLGLEKAGVRYSDKAIEVDTTLRTSGKNIYACGDVTGPYQFSHMAEYQAIIAVRNALFPFKQKVDYSAVPWCTFTDPELAHLGLTEDQARAQYKGIKIYKSFYGQNDRAVCDLVENGLAKVICDRRGRILGAHIVGTGAGEIIHGYVLAKSLKLHIGKISSAIHVYPTLSQIVKKTADTYYLDMLSSRWSRRVSKFFIGLVR